MPAMTSARAALWIPAALFLLVAAHSSLALSVQIAVDGHVVPVTQARTTVRETLKAAGVVLGPDDEVTPGLDSAPPSTGIIRVARVRFVDGAQEVAVPYHITVRPASPGLRPFHPTVVRSGHVGLTRITYRAKIVDGVEQERSKVSEDVVRQPVTEIVVSRRPQELGSRGAYTGRHTITALATAYDPGNKSCGRYADGRTCNGKRAGYGIIAVDPNVIPLGKKLFVPGYGYGISADVGSAIKGNHVDLGFNSRAGALKWGKHWVRVEIVD